MSGYHVLIWATCEGELTGWFHPDEQGEGGRYDDGQSDAKEGNDREDAEAEPTHDMSRRDYEHDDHRILDHLVRRLFLVMEHEQTYHEKREINA